MDDRGTESKEEEKTLSLLKNQRKNALLGLSVPLWKKQRKTHNKVLESKKNTT